MHTPPLLSTPKPCGYICVLFGFVVPQDLIQYKQITPLVHLISQPSPNHHLHHVRKIEESMSHRSVTIYSLEDQLPIPKEKGGLFCLVGIGVSNEKQEHSNTNTNFNEKQI
jgi:hypothetical protein